MNIVFLGTGSAFTLDNFQSNIMFEHESRKLLVDAGDDIRRSLNAMGLNYRDITDVYISHLHGDHTSGLEYLALCSYFDPDKEKINLYGHHRVLDALWDTVLQGRLRSVPGKRVQLSDYFNVFPLDDNNYFGFGRNKFELVQSVHIMDGFSIVSSYGLMITLLDLGKKLYITTDTQFNPNQIKDFYEMADIIIQDCEYLYFNETPIFSSVHSHYEELLTLPLKTRRKMYLTHYQDRVIHEDKFLEAIKDGFLGFLVHSRRHDFENFMNKK